MQGSWLDRSGAGAETDPQLLFWSLECDDVTTSTPWQLLKRQTDGDVRHETEDNEGDGEGTLRIRCPLCFWQPSASSRWTCVSGNSPEPPFNSCGTVWNTFDTHGKCPGCSHQWVWTTCLQCQIASRHKDWYDKD